MVAITSTEDPQPLDFSIVQFPIGIVEFVGLYSSMNSSFPPLGPTVRNSLITMFVAGVSAVTVGVGVLLGVGVIVDVGVIVVVGVMVVVGVIVGESVMVGVNVMVGVGVTVPVSVIVDVTVEVGDNVFRGTGLPSVKSRLLLSVSIEPLPFRKSAVVLLGAGASPAPSLQSAVVPYPTKSTTLASNGQPLPLNAVVAFKSATFPAVALMLVVVLVQSGVGSVIPLPPPEPNWIRKY